MITVTDLFCGAGGSGLGASVVPGVELRIAANHWPLAIETHAANFPGVEHDVEVRRYPRTNILWASPECTAHSQARGVPRAHQEPDLFGETLSDEASQRSRATMWDVPRFAEYHRYDAIIVENVVDAALWPLYPAWLHAMRLLGYRHHEVYLNSMHAPSVAAPRAPQSRDRLYVVLWREGNPAPDLEIRPEAWCAPCDRRVRAVQAWKKTERWGRYRAQYVYRCPRVECRNGIVEPHVSPASDAIDWSVQGQVIGERNRPLRPATLARIRAGLERHAGVPTLVPAGGTWNSSASPVTAPFRTRTTRETEGLLVPYYGSSESAVPVSRPVGTLTTRDRYALVEVIDRSVEQSRFRMLLSPEVQAAMAFRPSYRVLGTRREQIKQLGNGVTPPAAEFLIRAVVASLGVAL
ncbi:DNA cytosine methyltransferase [Actinoalloteichus sp. GBA129-24]|uniref:DNA cytosine methyltransferase n=1 Tax=Actinoalloteichus sp. GBA129-24 TaxID=1612551 RepID=UPI0009506632|nr:DNA cytosine methyltransferase [Actinoalloteichus sp. GBA129-24]APU20896.1 C-5 cytosine-specific DNA methylase [Actinoalloteichus sp. GBA129-24]